LHSDRNQAEQGVRPLEHEPPIRQRHGRLQEKVDDRIYELIALNDAFRRTEFHGGFLCSKSAGGSPDPEKGERGPLDGPVSRITCTHIPSFPNTPYPIPKQKGAHPSRPKSRQISFSPSGETPMSYVSKSVRGIVTAVAVPTRGTLTRLRLEFNGTRSLPLGDASRTSGKRFCGNSGAAGDRSINESSSQ